MLPIEGEPRGQVGESGTSPGKDNDYPNANPTAKNKKSYSKSILNGSEDNLNLISQRTNPKITQKNKKSLYNIRTFLRNRHGMRWMKCMGLK
jgi:hypothetical protein